MDNYGLTDNAPVNFFTMIPNMIDDSGLSAQAKALYLHLKRVAGEEGFCWKTQDQLAKHCGFSTKTIVKAKRELVQAKYIEIVVEPFETHPRHVIHLLNLWSINESIYRQSVSKETDSGFQRKSNAVSAASQQRRTHKEEPTKNISEHTKVFDFIYHYYGYPETYEKDPIPNHKKEASAIARMLKRGYSVDEICDAWKIKVATRGEYVSLWYVNEDMGKPVRGKQTTFILPREEELVSQAKERGLS